MKSFILLLLSFILVKVVSAQSLLRNGGFEEISDCPNKSGAIELAIGWTKISESPDLFSKCSNSNSFGVPANYMGSMIAPEGKSYAGIFLYMKQAPFTEARFDYTRQENLRNRLMSSMKSGKQYELSFLYSLADSSNYYSSTLSVTFTSSISGIYETGGLSQTIPIFLENHTTKEWHTAKIIFVANGEWNYATIGYSRKLFDFSEYKKSLIRNKAAPARKNNNSYCYYYLDSFLLMPVENKSLKQ